MRTAYCPKSHKELASESAGKEYGHVPGHQYHDVDVVVSERGGKFRVHAVESWGSAQGYDEEHGRREAIGRSDDSIRGAIDDARDRAKAAGIECEYLEQALSLAEDAAEEATAEAPPERANWTRVVEMENVSHPDRRSEHGAEPVASLADVAIELDVAATHDIDNRGGSGIGAGAYLEAMIVADDDEEDEAAGERVESVDDTLFEGLPLGSPKDLREFIAGQKKETCWDGNNHVPAPYHHSERLLARIRGRDD